MKETTFGEVFCEMPTTLGIYQSKTIHFNSDS